MDKLRRDIVELIIAIENNDPKLKEKATAIKDDFNLYLKHQYREIKNRADRKVAK